MNIEPPLVLKGAVDNGRILGATGQVLAVVVDHRLQCEDAQRLVVLVAAILQQKLTVGTSLSFNTS